MFLSPFPRIISFHCQQQSALKSYPLLPEEAACIASTSSPKRIDDFALGRYCAHQALLPFDDADFPIIKNEKTREPCWPTGIRGSISHSDGWAVAAVGHASEIKGIGIDLENLTRKVDFKINRHICVEEEKEWLESLSDVLADQYLKIIFSAKESIFKCFYPISKTYLNFKDAKVIIDQVNSSFEFILYKTCGEVTAVGFVHHGKFSIKKNMLMTSIFF